MAVVIDWGTFKKIETVYHWSIHREKTVASSMQNCCSVRIFTQR